MLRQFIFFIIFYAGICFPVKEFHWRRVLENLIEIVCYSRFYGASRFRSSLRIYSSFLSSYQNGVPQEAHQNLSVVAHSWHRDCLSVTSNSKRRVIYLSSLRNVWLLFIAEGIKYREEALKKRKPPTTSSPCRLYILVLWDQDHTVWFLKENSAMSVLEYRASVERIKDW